MDRLTRKAISLKKGSTIILQKGSDKFKAEYVDSNEKRVRVKEHGIIHEYPINWVTKAESNEVSTLLEKEVDILAPPETESYKAAIYKTGELSFSRSASKFFDLYNYKYILVGKRKNKKLEDELIIVPYKSNTRQGLFEIKEWRKTHFIRISKILNEHKVNYKTAHLRYTVASETINGINCIVLSKT